MAELRSFIFIDQLQPQTMCYLGTWIRGRLPRTEHGRADHRDRPRPRHRAADRRRAQARPRCRPGILVVERQFGYLEIHSRSTAAVQAGERAPCSPRWAPRRATPPRPQILASKLITRLDHQHAFLINRNKLGSMALPGESLFVLEMQPASYAILATNEAEKAARHQGRRLPHDRRHRPRVPGRDGGRRAHRRRCRGRGAGRCGVSTPDDAELLRSVTREVLADLLPGCSRRR